MTTAPRVPVGPADRTALEVSRGLARLGRTLRDPVVGEVARLAWPVVAQSLLHTLVFIVDRALLGRHGPASLASMQIAGPITWAMYSVLGAFTIGAMALVGRATGARDDALAASAARASLGLAVVAGVMAMVATPVVVDAIVAPFTAASSEARASARAYLSVTFFGSPLLLAALTATTILQAAGHMRAAMTAAGAANLVNVAVGMPLIFGTRWTPELGAGGAALGSVAGSGVELTIALALLVSGRASVRISRWPSRDDLGSLIRIARVSGAAFAERAIQQVGYFGFVLAIGALGTTAMAANQALSSIESICFLTADAVGIAAAAAVAQRLGAGRRDDARRALVAAAGIAVAFLSTAGLAFALAPSLLVRAFTSDATIVRTAVPCLFVAAAAQPFMALGTVMSEALRGAGATRVVLVVMLVCGLGVRLSGTWVFAHVFHLGLPGVWLGSTLDWIVRTAVFAVIVRRGRWLDTVV